MSNRLLKLSNRIQSEVVDLESVIDRIKEAWQRSKDSGDDYYLDSVALSLHGFYSGLESIFELIDEYGGFRHVVRNVYTFRFDPEKVEKLTTKASGVFADISPELLAFADFLQDAARES